MKGFFSVLNLNFLPRSADFGLLLLRCALGAGMLLLHGKAKLELLFGWGGWSTNKGAAAAAALEKLRVEKIASNADPLHIGGHLSLGLTAFAEVVCSALLIIGFCTRFASAALAVTMGVAFFMFHKMAFTGDRPGEMAALYLLGFLTILIAGPGKFSFDGNGGTAGSSGSSGKAGH